MEREIKYRIGDATQPYGSANKIIVHICNDIGAWGKGFVLAISKRWKEPENLYRQWFKSKENFKLGQVQFVKVEQDIWVANLIGQHKIGYEPNGNPPIRYESISLGLEIICQFALENNASVHMPRIGCGLAGGQWEYIVEIIQDKLTTREVCVTVYDLK